MWNKSHLCESEQNDLRNFTHGTTILAEAILKGKLSEWGFKENPYDACTMNKMIDGEQATIVWHVDDLKISHKKEGVVRQIIADLDDEFGRISPLTTTYGEVHDYLGMTIDYSTKGKVRFTMFDYLHEILENMPDSLKTNRGAATPAADHLFDTQDDGALLDKERAELFHSYTAKPSFAAKRARPERHCVSLYKSEKPERTRLEENSTRSCIYQRDGVPPTYDWLGWYRKHVLVCRCLFRSTQ